MKKFLLTLSSVFLFAASLSAQIVLTADSVLPDDESVFGRDLMNTIKFDSLHTILNQRFDSAGHNFVSDTFDGHGGMFVFDTSGSIHSSTLYTTNDGSGFVIMNSEGMGPLDTQRVTLTSPSFNTNNFNTLKVEINHHYKYSANDSAANLLISTNGTTWDLVKSFSADAADQGTSTAFATNTYVLGPQYLNKNTVYLRLVYATSNGYQWAVNGIKVTADKFSYGYAFFKPQPNATWDMAGVQYDGGSKLYVRKPAPAPYRFIDSIYNEDLKGWMHTTYSQNYFTLSGIIAHAHLSYSQYVDISAYTGLSDTLEIPTQFVMQYTGLHTKEQFPMHYNDKWSSDFAYTEVCSLRGQSFIIPSGTKFIECRRRVTVSQKDTVVGWGTMRLKGTDGIIDNFCNVLQLKTDYTQKDSFYVLPSESTPLKQSLFSNYMNNLSGLSNPNVQHYTKFNYLREGDLQPFVTVYMQDTFVTKIEVNNRPWSLDVAVLETATKEITVFPNPVTNHMVNISVAEHKDGQWNCDILNTVGQYIGSQQLNIDKANGNAVLTIPSSAAAGLYYLHITQNGRTVTVKPIQVQ